ncbi:MAG: hypothetical protein WDZ31_02160, partial [Phycisphaeraceae bacterium]
MSQWNRRMRGLMAVRPSTAGQLHRFVQVALGLDVPRRAMGEGHASPFDYLCDAYFEGGDPGLRVAQPSALVGDC